jgi:hypothetical protein
MLAAWRLLDAADLDGSIERWLRVVMQIIQGQRVISATQAADYVTAFRAVELGSTQGFTPVIAKKLEAKILATSLTVTGPVAVKTALRRGEVLARAMAIGETLSSGAAMRHVLDGGRSTLLDSIRSDRRSVGWARATSGRSCAFCAMLAGRGAVYREDTAGFQAHDSCSCVPEPIYTRRAALPQGSEKYREVWDQSDGTLEDFRNLYEKAAT